MSVKLLHIKILGMNGNNLSDQLPFIQMTKKTEVQWCIGNWPHIQHESISLTETLFQQRCRAHWSRRQNCMEEELLCEGTTLEIASISSPHSRLEEECFHRCQNASEQKKQRKWFTFSKTRKGRTRNGILPIIVVGDSNRDDCSTVGIHDT